MQATALKEEAIALINRMDESQVRYIVQVAHTLDSGTFRDKTDAMRSLFGILPPTASVEEAKQTRLEHSL